MCPKVLCTTWDERPERVLPSGVRRKVLSTDKVMLVQYLYDPGAIFPKHSHPQQQITIVEKGHLEFKVSDRTYHLGPGAVLMIPGNKPHSARVKGNSPVESINIFHPIKEEFLAEAKKKSTRKK